MNFVKQNILVTGSTGFIGQNLVLSLLKKGARVTGISLDNSSFRDDNYTHRKETIASGISLGNYDIIFHLAGIGYGYEYLDGVFLTKANLDCTIDILQGIKVPETTVFVFASSCSVYGKNSNGNIDENLNPAPISDYAKSKYRAEEYIKKFSENKNLKIAIARIFNVYGPKETNSLVYKIINSTKKERKMPFNPSLIRDFVHVDDVISGLQVLSNQGHGVYNLASGIGVTLEKVRLVVEGVLQKKLLTKSFLEDSIDESVASIGKIQKLGWNPKVSIEEGINDIVVYDD